MLLQHTHSFEKQDRIMSEAYTILVEKIKSLEKDLMLKKLK